MMRSVWVLVVVVALLLTGCGKKSEGEAETQEGMWYRAECTHPDHGDESWCSDWVSSEEDAISSRDTHKSDNPMHNPYVDAVYQAK